MSALGERPRAPRPGRAACAFFASVLTLSLFWAEAALAQTQNCPNPLPPQTARVHQVYRVDPGSNLVPRSSVDTQQPPPVPTELGDTIAVVVEDLESLIVEQRCRSNGGAIVLYLNGQAVPGATAYPPSDPANKTVYFQLRQSDQPVDQAQSRRVWTSILGRPLSASRVVRVSVGLSNQYAIPSDVTLLLALVSLGWFGFWCLILLLAVALFFWLTAKSDILRAPIPAPATGRRPYSLSRTQAAWWFFLALAAYLFIAIVTGQWNTGINSTVLALLGIAAGTTIGSAAIDAGKDTDDQRQMSEAAVAELLGRVAQAQATEQQLGARLKATDVLATAAGTVDDAVARANAVLGPLTPASLDAQSARDTTDAARVAAEAARAAESASHIVRPQLAGQLRQARSQLAELRSALAKAEGRSEGFFLDVVSDANGVSFHRFQLFVLTAVIGVVFVHGVWRDLTMPAFDQGLLGLVGLSSLSYLGLKVPEASVPRRS